jgi:hypothetical protein
LLSLAQAPFLAMGRKGHRYLPRRAETMSFTFNSVTGLQPPFDLLDEQLVDVPVGHHMEICVLLARSHSAEDQNEPSPAEWMRL